ncbi:DUF222 domain-containing protein [Mycobacterium tilburgii]|uniref:DUF222 domain-containing protein n=1 Tax=Mycobacterium tilburgii TaxID=44467 RepID=UPI0038995F12
MTDDEVLFCVDAGLAVTVPRWPSMTQGRLAAQVDRIVVRADKDAVRRRKDRQSGSEIGSATSGTARPKFTAPC